MPGHKSYHQSGLTLFPVLQNGHVCHVGHDDEDWLESKGVTLLSSLSATPTAEGEVVSSHVANGNAAGASHLIVVRRHGKVGADHVVDVFTYSGVGSDSHLAFDTTQTLAAPAHTDAEATQQHGAVVAACFQAPRMIFTFCTFAQGVCSNVRARIPVCVCVRARTNVELSTKRRSSCGACGVVGFSRAPANPLSPLCRHVCDVMFYRGLCPQGRAAC